jgi:DNA polymerase III epsilon subunit-like protein
MLGIALNDRAYFRGEQAPFSSVSLTAMCKKLGIQVLKSHDALADAIAEAKLYKTLMQLPNPY